MSVSAAVTQPAPLCGGLSQRLQDVQRMQQPVWVYDFDHARVLWANSASLEIWQADSLHELQCRDLAVDMTETVAQRLKQYQRDFESNHVASFREVWTLHPQGKPTTVEVVYTGIRLDDGRMAMFCEALSQQAFDAEALRSAEALLHTSVMITLYASTGEPLYRNPAARDIVCSADENLSDHFAHEATLNTLLSAESDEVSIVASVHTYKGCRWHDITARRCLDAVTGQHAWLISEVDVSRLKATEEHAQFLAEHDTLTGLPNRNHVSIAFQNRIDQLLASGESGALIFIDLDRFKDINDSLGHDAGDTLLIETASRLTDLVRQRDSVARLGGDEFLLLLGHIEEPEEIDRLATRILQSISEPMLLQGREVRVTPSVGISLFPENGRNITDLMRHADLAMYHAKDGGRNGFSFFSQRMSDAVESRMSLESQLMVALREEQFVAYFQPRVDVQTNRVKGAEALARWIHPEHGFVSPGDFIPACESAGLIGSLGKSILSQSVRAQKQLADAGHDLQISVNLSPLQFGEDSLVDDVMDIIRENDGNPSRIELEITESVLLGHDQGTIDKLHALVDLGFRIAIDDFGTGYSNLAYLHRYPINSLKIDRSFIQELDSAQPIVELIVSMARLFKLDVVAEGVETTEQLAALRAFDCQEYQGFLFERAVELPLLFELLARHQS